MNVQQAASIIYGNSSTNEVELTEAREVMCLACSEGDWAKIGHYYEPIAFYDGNVLKYAGIACRLNLARKMQKPGMIMLDAYKGDRIRKSDHSSFDSIYSAPFIGR